MPLSAAGLWLAEIMTPISAPAEPAQVDVGAVPGSALGLLRRLARLLEPVLLAFLPPRVSGEKPNTLERTTALRVGLDQRARKPQTHRTGLPGHTAAVNTGDDVV